MVSDFKLYFSPSISTVFTRAMKTSYLAVGIEVEDATICRLEVFVGNFRHGIIRTLVAQGHLADLGSVHAHHIVQVTRWGTNNRLALVGIDDPDFHLWTPTDVLVVDLIEIAAGRSVGVADEHVLTCVSRCKGVASR